MKTVSITQAFEGYPVADDAGVHFAVTNNPVEVPDAFADLIVGKGLAEFATARAPASIEPTEKVNHEVE